MSKAISSSPPARMPGFISREVGVDDESHHGSVRYHDAFRLAGGAAGGRQLVIGGVAPDEGRVAWHFTGYDASMASTDRWSGIPLKCECPACHSATGAGEDGAWSRGEMPTFRVDRAYAAAAQDREDARDVLPASGRPGSVQRTGPNLLGSSPTRASGTQSRVAGRSVGGRASIATASGNCRAMSQNRLRIV